MPYARTFRFPRIGELRHPVTIEVPTITKDEETGGQAVSWSTFAQVKAAVRPLTGMEHLVASQIRPELAYRVTIRYLAGVKPKMRVIHGAKALEIEAVTDLDERHRFMMLMCREWVQQ